MFNKVVAFTLPYMPKSFVWMFSKRYVAGEQIIDALNISKQLNRNNITVTVDLLGEFIYTLEQAELNKAEYLKIVQQFTNEGIRGNFSIKPTSFGLLIDQKNAINIFVRWF